MTNIKIKKLLTASVSGLAIAACMGASAHAATTNVGTSASNTGTATDTGVLYLFNVANGTLTNSGTISTNGTSAAVVATSVSGSTLNNTGTISNTGTGPAVLLGGGTAALTNSGTITSAASTVVTTGTGTVTINNNSGGTISTTATTAGNAAIDIFAPTAVVNSGTITAAGAANAIRVSTGVAAAATTIVNNAGGVISSTGAGAAILVQAPITSITNAGTIQSTSGTAIKVDTNGSITSGITNTATGSIIGGGGDAIDNSTSAAALTINNAGTITGNIRLGNAGANVVNVTGGTISGQILGGTNSTINYSGSTTANGIVGAGTVNHSAGTLTVASGINATTVNNTGGTLALNAGITGNVVNSGGTIATTSNQTITGNYTQSAGATLQSAVSSRTTASTLNVTGTATLADSSIIRAQIASGVQLQSGDSLTVLSAGTLTATAANLTITSNDPLTLLTASKSGNSLVLTASTPTTAQAQSNILTNSGISSVASLQSLAGDGQAGTNINNLFNSYTGLLSALRTSNFSQYTTISNALGNLTGTAAANALKTLSPTAATSSGTSQGVSAGAATSGGIVLSRLDNNRNAEAGMSAGDKYSRNAKAWFQPYGSALSQDKKDGVDGYDADTYGILFGGDVNILDNTRAGIAVGYNHTKVDAKDSSVGSGAGTDGYEAKLYAGYSLNNYFVDGLLGVQYNQNDTHRFSTLLAETARGSYDSWLYNANVKAGYNFKQTGGLILTPSVGFNYSYLNADGYTEHGATINNKVNSSDFTGATSELGLKAAYPIKRTTGTLTPEVRASWLHEFGDEQFSNTSTFTGGGASYTTKGAKIDDDAARFGVGLGFQTIGKTEINADVDYITRSSSDAVAGKLNVKVPF